MSLVVIVGYNGALEVLSIYKKKKGPAPAYGQLSYLGYVGGRGESDSEGEQRKR
jgi:hypothetical protein